MTKSMWLLNKYNPLILLVAGTAIACADATNAQEPAVNEVEASTPTVAEQTQAAELSCEMAVTMKGWSAIVSRAEGGS